MTVFPSLDLPGLDAGFGGPLPGIDPSAGSQNTETYGPRLATEARSIAYSAWGSVIPITFGVRKLNGMVIWAAPLDELEYTEKNTTYPNGGFPSLDLPGLDAGFGSPGVTSVKHEYYYFADFVVSFGYGDPTNTNKYVLRIWANGLLIYDARDPNAGDGDLFYQTLRTPVAFSEMLQFKFHQGTETQLPPDIIKDYENPRYAEEHATDPSINVVPGFRGQMLLELKKFPVTPFNNALPDIQIELADGTDISNEVEEYTDFGDAATWTPNSGVVDWNNLLFYETDGVFIRTLDLTTMALINNVAVARVKLPTDETQGNAIQSLEISRYTGQLYACTADGEPVQIFNVNALTGVCTPMKAFGGNISIGPFSGSFENPYRILVTSYMAFGLLYDEIILSESSGGTNLFSSEEGEQSFLHDHYGGFSLQERMSPGELGLNRGVFYYNYENFIWRHVGGAKTQFADGIGVEFFQYIQSMNALLICYDNGTNATFVLRSVPHGEIIWTSASVAGGFASLTSADLWKMDTRGSQLMLLRGGAITILDIEKGTLINERNIAYPATLPYQSGRFKAIFGGEAYIYLDRASAERTNLKLFILFAARLAGFDVDGLDAQLVVDDSIADIIIDGAYIAEANVSFRNLLDELRKAFMFDVRESNQQIVVTKREIGDDSNDFAFGVPNLLMLDSSTPVSMQIDRREDNGIPSIVSYQFLDYLNEYQPNTVYAQRSGTNSSRGTAGLRIPIIMRFAEAKVWAYKYLYSLWGTRESFNIRVGMSEVQVEPADVGQIVNDGRTYRCKVERISYNTDWSMTIGLTNYVDESAITIEADVPLGYTPSLQYYSPSTAYIFDTPNVFPRDSDFVRDQRLAAITILTSPDVPARRWNGAYLDFTTVYGDSWDYLFTDKIPESHMIGTTLTALNDTNAPFSIDDESRLDVKVSPSLVLATCTDDQFFTGEINVAAIKCFDGVEIISFRDVEDLGDSNYRLSHFLRGRRGTEWQVGRHTASSTILFMTYGMQVQLPVDYRVKDTQITVTATTIGRDTLKATTRERVKGVWQLPLQPTAVHAVRDVGTGTITITWQQRTRAPGALSFVEDEPEAVLPRWENVLKFEAFFENDTWFINPDDDADGITLYDDFTDGRGTKHHRRVTLTTADQIAIFGDTIDIDRFNIGVFQHSKEWGRGTGMVKKVYIDDE